MVRFSDRVLGDFGGFMISCLADFKNHMSAVVDEKAFSKIARYIDLAKASKDAEVIAGGTCTVIPNHRQG